MVGLSVAPSAVAQYPGQTVHFPNGDITGDGLMDVADGVCMVIVHGSQYIHDMTGSGAVACSVDADCTGTACSYVGGCGCRKVNGARVCVPDCVGSNVSFGHARDGTCGCTTAGAACRNSILASDFDMNCDGELNAVDLMCVTEWLLDYAAPMVGPGLCDGDGDTILDGCDDDEDNDGSPNWVDCDSSDSSRWPGAAERCGDGRDNDCDSVVDDGCAPGCEPVCQDWCGPDGCGGMCTSCPSGERCFEGACVPETVRELPPIGQLGPIPRFRLAQVPPGMWLRIRVTVPQASSVVPSPLLLWVTAASLDTAVVEEQCDPAAPEPGWQSPVLSFDLGPDRAVVASFELDLAGGGTVDMRSPAGPPLNLDLIAASRGLDTLSTEIAVDVEVHSAQPSDGESLATFAFAYPTQLKYLSAAVVGPLDFRRGDALFIGAMRVMEAIDGEPTTPVEVALLTSPAGDGNELQCVDRAPFDACLECGAAFLRSASDFDAGVFADHSVAGELVRLVPSLGSSARHRCGRPNQWFGSAPQSHAGYLLVGLADAEAQEPSPSAATTRLRTFWSRHKAPETALAALELIANGETPGEWNPGAPSFDVYPPHLIDDDDRDGLTWEIEHALGTCDSPAGPGASDGKAGLGGRTCAELQALVDHPFYLETFFLKDCPAANPSQLYHACDQVPAGCVRPGHCWSAADTDNDGLDDLTEVFGVVVASDKDPKVKPKLFEAGSLERRSVYAPPRGPLHVADWRLPISRMAPVSPNRYDVLLEVEVDVPLNPAPGDHDHRLTDPFVQNVRHIFETEGRECAYEPYLCNDTFVPGVDPPCCAFTERYEVRLHLFRQERWFEHFANHERAYYSFGALDTEPSLMAGGLDELAIARGQRTFGLEAERRFTKTFRYARVRPDVHLTPYLGVYPAVGIANPRGFWVRSTTPSDFAHELGHALGLFHINGQHQGSEYSLESSAHADGNLSPVYPSLMNYASGYPAKSTELCLTPPCGCDGSPRFSRGLLPPLSEENLVTAVTAASYENAGRYVEWLRCAWGDYFVSGCVTPQACAAHEPCTCDWLEPECNCSTTDWSCSLDFPQCVPPDYSGVCEDSEGDGCIPHGLVGGVPVVTYSFDSQMRWSTPGYHSIYDQNDWLRMYATGRRGLGVVSFPEYLIARLPFNYPVGYVLGATEEVATEDVGGLMTMPQAFGVSIERFGLSAPPHGQIDAATVGWGYQCGPADQCTHGTACVPIDCGSAPCPAGGGCGPEGRCMCSNDTECASGLCDFDGECVEGFGVCACPDGHGDCYPLNGGAFGCGDTSAWLGADICPAVEYYPSHWWGNVARLWTTAAAGHPNSYIRFPARPQSRLEGLDPPIALHLAFNVDRHVFDTRVLFEASSLRVELTPANATDPGVYVLQVAYATSAGWRYAIAPLSQEGAPLYAHRWYRLEVAVAQLGAQSFLSVEVERLNSRGTGWSTICCKQFVVPPLVPIVGDVSIGGTSVLPAKRFSGRIDNLEVYRGRTSMCWSGVAPSSLSDSPWSAAGAAPSPTAAAATFAPATPAQMTTQCDDHLDAPGTLANPACGQDEICFGGGCAPRCRREDLGQRRGLLPAECPPGTRCQGIAVQIHDDLSGAVAACLPLPTP